METELDEEDDRGRMPNAHRDFPLVSHDRFGDGDIGTLDYPNWSAARTVLSAGSDAERVRSLKRSITETGLQSPITVFTGEDGDHWVGDGHHRIEALRQLKMPVPVRWQSYHRGHTEDLVGVPPKPDSRTASSGIPLPGNDQPYPEVAEDRGSHSYLVRPHGLYRHEIIESQTPLLRRHAVTPVPANTAPYQHRHPWLPHGHFFAPTAPGLDPRLFDGDRMRPEVRRYLLGLLDDFWAPRYGGSWQTWARVYLAGSEASHFYGNNDLDILIGIDHEALHHHVDHFTGEPDNAIDEQLTDELRHGLNNNHRMLPGPDGKDTGPWENTWYVNPDSYDIRDIKPYAAYDLTRDEWAVKPVEVPGDFGPEKLPESTWDVFDALMKLIKAVAGLPDGTREREGAALYDYLHADRHSAFGPDGSGLYDPANAVWKALDAAPGHPLQHLIDWKRAHDAATAATDQETAA